MVIAKKGEKIPPSQIPNSSVQIKSFSSLSSPGKSFLAPSISLKTKQTLFKVLLAMYKVRHYCIV